MVRGRKKKAAEAEAERKVIAQQFIVAATSKDPRASAATVALGDQEKIALKRELQLKQPWWRRK
ncbi:MAG TPA: hypothetical protein VF281_00045 [Candidatus Saccharimonadales bacterium]